MNVTDLSFPITPTPSPSPNPTAKKGTDRGGSPTCADVGFQVHNPVLSPICQTPDRCSALAIHVELCCSEGVGWQGSDVRRDDRAVQLRVKCRLQRGHDGDAEEAGIGCDVGHRCVAARHAAVEGGARDDRRNLFGGLRLFSVQPTGMSLEINATLAIKNTLSLVRSRLKQIP